MEEVRRGAPLRIGWPALQLLRAVIVGARKFLLAVNIISKQRTSVSQKNRARHPFPVAAGSVC